MVTSLDSALICYTENVPFCFDDTESKRIYEVVYFILTPPLTLVVLPSAVKTGPPVPLSIVF